MNYSFKIIKPVVITDARLVSSSVAEPAAGESAWNAATAYTVGQEVIRTTTHKTYKRIVAGTTATPPENDTTNWLEIGSTNRWKMLDDTVGTQTSNSSDIVLVLTPGSTSGIYLAELEAREVQIQMKDSVGGTVVATRSEILDDTLIGSFYDWFFADFRVRTETSFTDLPYHYTNPEITISVIGTSTRKCGVLKLGQVIDIGYTQYGASVGIIDYSRKETDVFGVTSVVERPFSKRLSADIFIDSSNMSKVYKTLADLRSKPAVYISTPIQGYEVMNVYGYYKDFLITVNYPTMQLCNLEVEGLI